MTDNRKTMPAQVREFETAGHQHWSVFELRRSKVPIGLVVQTLYEIWGASEAEEWEGQIRWIPLEHR